MAINSLNFISNVGKSFGYAMVDNIKSYNPVISSLASEIKSTKDEAYETIKDFSFSKGNIDGKALSGKVKDTVKSTWKNTMDDLKSGNWYNKQKIDQLTTSIAGAAMGFDEDMFNFDDDWGDFDFDDLEESETLVGDAAIIKNQNNNARDIMNSVDKVGSKVSGSIINATVESSNYIADSARQSSKALYVLNQQGFAQVTKSMVAINDTIGSFAKIGEPLTTHMQNSSIFFTKTTQSLNKIEQSLEKIAKNTMSASLASEMRRSSVKGTFSDIFSNDTGISIDSYKNMVKENLKEYRDLTSMALNGIKSLGKSGMSGKISLSSFMVHQITNVMLPKVFKDSMENLNDSLKYSLAGVVTRLRNKDFGDNFLLDTLVKSFLPKKDYKDKINTGAYEKGKVAWDGYSRKALIDVIPTTLLRIYSAISGEPEKRYDYERGKYVTITSIQQNIDKEKQRAINRAGGEFRKDALNKISANNNITAEQQSQLKKEVESYFKKSFETGKDFYNLMKDDFNASNFGLTDKSLEVLRDLVREYRQSTDREKRNRANKFVSDINLEQDSFSNRKRKEEARGISNQLYLLDGSIDENNKPLGNQFGQDQHGHNIMFYLQGIYQYTGYLADNINNIGNIRGKFKRRNKINKNSNPQDIEIPTFSDNIINNSVSGSNEDDRYYGKTEEEIKREKFNKKIKEATKAFNSNAEQFTEGVKDSLFESNSITGKIREFYDKPFEAVAGLLNSIGFSLNKLIWGSDDMDEGDFEKGVFGYIMKNTKEAMDKFNDFINDKLNGLGDNIKDFFHKITKDKFKDFKNDTISNLQDAADWFGNSVGDFVFGKKYMEKRRQKREENQQEQNMDQAYNGRKVTKSGVISVSEGELIIPAEFNPFYNKKVNKKQQRKNERNNAKKFLGYFDNGGTVSDDGETKGPGSGETKEYDGIKDFFFESLYTLKDGILKFKDNVIGESEKEAKDKRSKDRGIISQITKTFLEEAGENTGAMGAGALIGGGVSLLTGAVVGPVFGAAIGAATGLAIRSKTVQKLLFGETNEKGDFNGGIFNKELSNFLVKQVPELAKGGAIGLAAGTFMGSPLMGAILGSSISFINTNNMVKSFLFGQKLVNGAYKEGVIPKELQDTIKKAAPNIGAGVIAGIVAGPFGMTGNIIMGAALGHLTTTEKFHNFMFGEDGKGGLVETIREKVVGNIENIFGNMVNLINGFGKNLLKEIGKKIEDLFIGSIAPYLRGEKHGLIGRAIGGITSLGMGLTGGITNFVGNRLGNISDFLQNRNLSLGYGIYDRKQKRNMFAEERMQARSGKTIGNMGNFDQMLANVNSLEELDVIKSQLEDAKDPNRIYRKNKTKAMNTMYLGLSELDTNVAGKIGKLVMDGKKDKAIDYINKLNVKDEDKLKYINAVNQGEIDLIKSKDTLSSQNRIINEFKEKYNIDITDRRRIHSMIDQINYEKTNTDKFAFNEQKVEEDKKTWRERVLNIFKSMDINIATLSNGKTAEQEDQSEVKSVKNEAVETINKETQQKENDDKFTYETDAFGNVHKFTTNFQGEPEEVNNDSTTKKSRKFMDKFKDSIIHIPIIGEGIKGLIGLFGTFKNKLLGDEENKKESGLLSTISESFSNSMNDLKNTISQILFGTDGSGTITTKIKGLAKLTGAITILAAATGKLDKLFHDLDKNQGNPDKETIAETKDGKPVTKDENGNYIDSDGNIVDYNDIVIRKGDTDTLSQRIRTGFGREVTTGRKSALGSSLRTIDDRLTKGSVTKFVGKFTKVFSVDDAVAITAADDLGVMVMEGLSKFGNVLKKIPILRNLGSAIDDMSADIGVKIAQKLGSSGVKSIARLASNAVVFAKIAFVVTDFTTGFEDARTTLGITDKPTFGQRIISGLLRAIKNFIPIVGVLIPDATVIDIFCKHLAPALGMDTSELMKQRQQAQEEIDAYNEANGTNLTVAQYMKQVKKDYTWTERLGNTAKTTFAQTKQKIGNIKKAIEEQGVAGYINSTVSNMGSSFINSYKENGGGINGILSGIGDSFNNILPGILGEIGKKNSEILKLATKGDLKNLWGTGLSDFGGEQEGDVTTVAPSMFAKLIGQVPLFMTKLFSSPLALAIKGIGALKNFEPIKNIIDKVIGTVDLIKKSKEEGDALLADPESHIKDYFKIDDPDPENPVGGFTKSIITISRLSSLPIALVRKVGDGFFDWFKNTKSNIINSFTAIQDEKDKVVKYASKGKWNKMWDVDGKDEADNPIGGFEKALLIGSQVIHSIPCGINIIGKSIGNSFKSMVENTKTDFNQTTSAIKTIMNYAIEGEPGKSFNVTVDFSGSPLDPIFTFGLGIGKIVGGIVGLFTKLGEFLGDAWESLKNSSVGKFVSDGIDTVGDFINNAKDSASNFVSGALGKASNFANNAYKSFQGWINGGGSGIHGYSGGGSGNFISQFDTRYKDIPYAGETVAEKGCAPAVATMISNAYGRKLNMNTAISASKKYQNKQGTSADYFGDVLGKQGIDTQYFAGKNANDTKKHILQSLAQGGQVILLGKNKNNINKDKSPFGPNPHYVLATGLDKNGNIIINDPENNTPKLYNINALGNANLGISTMYGTGAGSSYDTENARLVWGYLTSNGYSPAAAAGILGNMYQESGVKFDAIQGGGKGPGTGIVQWERGSGRFDGLLKRAKKNGTSWKDPQTQLDYLDYETKKTLSSYWDNTYNDVDIDGTRYVIQPTTLEAFLNSTDPQEATKQFEKAFERAGKPNFKRRIEAAIKYYNLYNDSKYTGTFNAGTPITDDGSTTISSSSTTDSISSSGGILAAISTAFSAIDNLFNFGDSLSSTTTNSTINGITNNLGSVPVGKGNAGQKKIVQYARSILGKNQYTQDTSLRTKVGQGYSDCSAFAQWCYKNGIGIDPGSNTGTQITSDKLVVVDNNSTPNIKNLEPGDLLFFKSSKPNNRYKNVGHVEVYGGNGNVIGHGSGIGPKERNLEQYAKNRASWGGNYIQAMRYKDIDKFGSKETSGSGSGIESPINFSTSKPTVKKTKPIVSNTVNNSGSISIELLQQLLTSIIAILNNVSNNTGYNEKIYHLLYSYLNNKSRSSNTMTEVKSETNKKSSNRKVQSEELDDNIVNLVNTLAAIAKG